MLFSPQWCVIPVPAEFGTVSEMFLPQGAALEPGQSVEIDRVYFEIPKKSKPTELTLMWRRFVLGRVTLKP